MGQGARRSEGVGDLLGLCFPPHFGGANRAQPYDRSGDNSNVPVFLPLSVFLSFALSAVTHYDVKLALDSEARFLSGSESIRFEHAAGAVRWDKQIGLKIEKHRYAAGTLDIGNTTVHAAPSRGGEHIVNFEYTATPTIGLRRLSNGQGLFTAFHCAAWMVCASSPEYRATLRLEIVTRDSNLRAVGPGVERKHWRDAEGQHWIFETPSPTQSYLWSFAVARLQRSRLGHLEIFAPTSGPLALLETAEAERFFRERTGVDVLRNGYRQVFLPQAGVFGQEAAGLALMTETALQNLETKEDVVLMAHELAHQWWGVSVGIRSWSDFWLNEGVAEYVSLLYLEHRRGSEPFLAAVEKLKTRLTELQVNGQDRPLHFERWKDANEALGPLPYVKGALFLHRLRSQLGDKLFWQGMARYSKQHAGKLVDSNDFKRAFEDVTGLDLGPTFSEEVYGR